MHVTLYGGPHDGRTLDADPDETLRLPVLERRADGGPPDLGELAVYAWRGRRDAAGDRIFEIEA
ncbi:hypothetical protein SEA_FINKLE_36 [Gordonia phage Finkle]|uniref:Uncharacterized protein n=1 Tax=Gordonia phage Finkle TaxID=2926099 RepID=A0A9E7NHK3_9CAUD|nr:hypothetical protein QEH33_gp36 [Gordonia phage Finkle]UTN92953.1 hypothetical protein SEA_FINKLE_36 [Gordonia phage Finkle]